MAQLSVGLHAKRFESTFSSSPDAVVVAPGRVNLIGEHIDYMGYSVLPCALNQAILIGVAKKADAAEEGFLIVRHFSPSTHPQTKFTSLSDMRIDYEANPRWTSYIVAGYFGLVEYVASDRDVASVGKLIANPKEGVPVKVFDDFKAKLGCPMPPALRMLVNGNIPMAAGVSSSSALVVASLMAFASALKVNLTANEVADVCANCERHVGTAGGGMDQASICLSVAGAAQFISFNPLNNEVIALPQSARFVVSNTFVEAPKAVHAATHFNARVFECRIAILLLLKHAVKRDVKLEEVPRLTFKRLQEELKMSYTELETLIEKNIRHTPYTPEEVEALVGREALEALFKSPIGGAVWEKNAFFEPYRRAIHVVREASRVEEFVATSRGGKENQPGEGAEEEKLKVLGKLMDASDKSLTCLFDVGCPELTQMTQMARRSGAYGSRLTGAGWGGCVVSLVPEQEVDSFCSKMQSFFERYKEPELVARLPQDANMRVFSVTPGEGAKTHVQWEAV